MIPETKHEWLCDDCGKVIPFRQPELPPEDWKSEQNDDKECPSCSSKMYFDVVEVAGPLVTPKEDAPAQEPARLVWTKELPKAPGWYWRRVMKVWLAGQLCEQTNPKPDVVEVDVFDGELIIGGIVLGLEAGEHDEWAGPFPQTYFPVDPT